MYKFRTMTPLHTAERKMFDAGNLSRITCVGRFLRKTKLDELPQLWNVLKGDMSFVGPRPEVRQWVSVYPERWGRILALKPGITDPASIVYRDEEITLSKAGDPDEYYRNHILPHKLDLYEHYLKTRSIIGDIIIMANTVLAILRNNEKSAVQGDVNKMKKG